MHRTHFCLAALAAVMTGSQALAQQPLAPAAAAGQVAVQPDQLPQPVADPNYNATVQHQAAMQAVPGAIGVLPHAYAGQFQVAPSVGQPAVGQTMTQTTIGPPTYTTYGPQLQPVAIPPSPGGAVTAISPQPALSVTASTYNPAPIHHQHVQSYVPSYYWYYYQPPYQANVVQPVAVAPMAVVPVMPGAMMGGNGPMASSFGPMFNARGEAGHVRYPYYSYRRPWYFPGQPSFNVTIDGPVW